MNVTVDDSVEVPMFLDFCASHTVISPGLASRLGLDTTAAKTHLVRKMSIADLLETEDVLVVVADLSRFQESMRQGRFEGIIGATFLDRYKLTIDYKSERIYIHRR